MRILGNWFVIITSPRAVGVASIGFLLFGLVFDGTLYSIYKLYRQEQILVNKIKYLSVETKDIKVRLDSALDPRALARQAHNRFDLVNKDDLIFVFTD